MNAKNVLNYAADQAARFVSVRFTDLVGAWHHLTYPIDMLDEDSFEDGFGFDASSLRGWAAINESDMLMVPDPERYWIDPFMDRKTLCMICDVVDPITKKDYWLDPRALAKRAMAHLKSTGIAETVYFGPEAEFFVFDNVSFHNENNSCAAMVDSGEGCWNARIGEGNSGYHIRHKEGYV